MAPRKGEKSKGSGMYSDEEEEVKSNYKVTKTSWTTTSSTTDARTIKSSKAKNGISKERNDISSLQTKVLGRLAIFGMVIFLSFSTRIYKLDEPTHIW